jgi:hypothetical protein
MGSIPVANNLRASTRHSLARASGDVWIPPKRHKLRLALVPERPAPEFAAGWCHSKMHIAARKAWLYLCSLDRQISKCHRRQTPISKCARTLKINIPARYPHAKLAPAKYYWTTKEDKSCICRVYHNF